MHFDGPASFQHLLQFVPVPQLNAQGPGGFLAAIGEVVVGHDHRNVAAMDGLPGVDLLHGLVAQLLIVPFALDRAVVSVRRF